MSSTESKLASTLTSTHKEIMRRVHRKNNMMAECIQHKLDNSLDLYESDLEETCRYILIRNPITITKNVTKVMEEDEEDYE